MAVKIHTRSKVSRPGKNSKTSPSKEKPSSELPPVDPNSNAVPFHVTAFAASVFQPPAISDAIEEEPLFDRAKAQRAGKSKKK
jgi:hypothetical protein